MNTQTVIKLPNTGIEDANIQRFIDEQADFYIGWNYDYLVRCAEYQNDSADRKTLSQAQKDHLKDEAIREYMSSHQELIHDLQAIGA